MGHPHDLEFGRREFLQVCALLGVTGVSCSGLRANLRSTAAVLNQPAPMQWRPVLNALSRTLLPFESAAFPVSEVQVAARLDACFPIADASEFGALHGALVLFDDIGLVGERLALFVDDERKQLVERDLPAAQVDAEIDRAVHADAAGFAAFAKQLEPTTQFVALDLAQQRAYLALWAHSAFTLRRRFYRSVKVLMMVAAYSLPQTWAGIGYDGPLLARG